MFFHAAKARLEYRMWGEVSPERPLIALLHEGLGCVEMWRRFPQALHEATKCPVLAWSRAGYGASSPRPAPWPLSYMQDEAEMVLPGILDQTGAQKIILLGHSDGASIAAIYMGAMNDPRILGGILLAPHFFVEDISVSSIRQAAIAYEQTDLRHKLKKYHGGNVDNAFWGWNRAWLDPGFRNWDITCFLDNITAPLLAVQGADDQYGTLDQLAALGRHCHAPVEMSVIEKCGHAAHLEQPEQTLDVISRFVKQLACPD